MSSASPSRPQVVVLDDWERALTDGAGWNTLRERVQLAVHHSSLRGPELRAAIGAAEVLVLNRDRTPLDAGLIAAMPQLQLVVHTGPRNLKIDREALASRGIPVVGTRGGPARESTCEQTWALILAARRRLLAQCQGLSAGRWREGGTDALPAMLHGKRLGLLGLGEIGSRVARVGAAFGMDVVAWSPNLTADRATKAGARALPLDELMATADVVSLHLVAGERTHGLVDARLLGLMKPDAVLVNTARAALVAEDDLVAALRAGRPGYAALDVHETEPLPAQHPLRQLPQVLLTPHMGFLNQDTQAAFSRGTVEALDRWLVQREQ